MKKVLIVEDEKEIREILKEQLSTLGCQVFEAQDTFVAETMLQSQAIDLVISDNYMPGRTGLKFFEEYLKKNPGSKMQWVFISANGDPSLMEQACKLGSVDFLQKPFGFKEIKSVFDKLEGRTEEPLMEIMDIVKSIAGVQLGKEKKLLVETRIMRRARNIGLASVSEYLQFFKENRNQEVTEIISLMTTHTTEFFREPDHFDYLYENVFPALVKERKPITFWSAACSTGEEIYSLAMCFSEYIADNGLTLKDLPAIKFIGSDIDTNSVEKAKEGIYPKSALGGLSPDLIQKYFDVGEGELSEYVRIKDSIHALCSFDTDNLQAASYKVKEADVIFIRNVLIYFKIETVKEIAVKMERVLTTRGHLFLGHSESISNMDVPYKVVGNSIYVPKKGEFLKPKEKNAGLSLVPTSKAETSSRVKVFIIDDSKTVRLMLRKILSADQGFDVVGEAENPIEAETLLPKLKVDVITLDIHMPKMDGVTYLETIKNKNYPPVVMVSSINYEDAVNSLKCFELGAVDYIEKPQNSNLENDSDKIRAVVANAARARKVKSFHLTNSAAGEKINTSAIGSDCLIAIGASTGGVEALTAVLTQFPSNSPPVLVVQHMPPYFTQAFAKRLSQICKIAVCEAANGQKIEKDTAYIAPGGRQMKVNKRGQDLFLEVNDDPPVNRHHPSVDYLFESIVPLCKTYRVVSAILTGMGNDGAKFLKVLKESGAHTIAQDEESSVVFGMPKEAIKLGGVDEILPLPSIAYHLFNAFKPKKKNAA